MTHKNEGCPKDFYIFHPPNKHRIFKNFFKSQAKKEKERRSKEASDRHARDRHGSRGGPGRRARSNGAATAAALGAWTWRGSTLPEGEELTALEQRMDRAEAWLREKWTVDRNPGGRGENLAWLVDLERAETMLLLPPEIPKRRAKRRDGYLADYQLPDWGWNEQASMQDVFGPAGSLPSGAGGGAGVGPRRLPRGLGAVPRVEWDLDDTASATLALGATTRTSAKELRFAIRRRFSSAKRLPEVDRFAVFVESLRPRAETDPCLPGRSRDLACWPGA